MIDSSLCKALAIREACIFVLAKCLRICSDRNLSFFWAILKEFPLGNCFWALFCWILDILLGFLIYLLFLLEERNILWRIVSLLWLTKGICSEIGLDWIGCPPPSFVATLFCSNESLLFEKNKIKIHSTQVAWERYLCWQIILYV